MTAGPLHGLRVVELATGVAGPYAGRLLAMLGATVVKVEPPGGDPARDLPVDDLPFERPGPFFTHLNAGKRSARSDVLPEALGWADVVLRDESGDDDALAMKDPGTPRASVTPVSQEGPLVITVSGGGTDELLVQAATGLLAASTDDDGTPLRLPGPQSQYLAGAYAAVAALAGAAAGVRAVRVSRETAALTAYEATAAGLLHTASSSRPDAPEEARRNSGFLSQTYPSGVFACADGHVVPGTVRPTDWLLQCQVYGRDDLVYDPRFVWARRWENRAELERELRPWYASRTRQEIFTAALDAGWAAAKVLTARDVLADPHLKERGFLQEVGGDTKAVVPAGIWREPTRPTGDRATRLAAPGEDTAWFDPAHPRRSPAPRPPAPASLRVLELTVAWSGPLTGRILGTLGADVVRVEVGDRPDGMRTRHRWHELGVPVPPGVDPDRCTWDASAQFNSFNRAKRAVSVDLRHPDGLAVFTDLLRRADVLIVNLGHDALERRGLTEFVEAEVGRGLVALVMPALGATGPHRAMAGYGMLQEGMGGLAARYGRPGEAARVSYLYYPDGVAGVHGAVAVLAALAGREPGGSGRWIDLSQQETMLLQLAEGVVLASREGREPGRTGNREPGARDSGIRSAADGFVAFVDRRASGPVPHAPETAGSATALESALHESGVAAARGGRRFAIDLLAAIGLTHTRASFLSRAAGSRRSEL